MSKLSNFINTMANEEGLYDSAEVDNIEKEIKAEIIAEILNMTYCSYDGDCMGSKEDCLKCGAVNRRGVKLC